MLERASQAIRRDRVWRQVERRHGVQDKQQFAENSAIEQWEVGGERQGRRPCRRWGKGGRKVHGRPSAKYTTCRK